MGKKIAFALVLIILPSISALYAQPESIILKYIAKQRPAVAFNHGFHMSRTTIRNNLKKKL